MTYQEMKAIIPGACFNQFGKKVLVSQLRFATLEAIFKVDHEVQRKLDPKRRTEIREFIIDSLEEEDFYFSPFIFSARGNIKEVPGGGELKAGCNLYILDGQHRTYALASAIGHLKARKEMEEDMRNWEIAEKLQSHIEKLEEYPVSMQIYLDLDTQEEKQLFTDINTERKEPHTGLVTRYDQRDEYAELTRKVAGQLENKLEIEQKLSRITNYNSAVTSLSIMRKCILALFEGILTTKNGKATFGSCSKEEAATIAQSFFETWINIFPKNIANRTKYTSGLSGIQMALAYTVFLLNKNHYIPYQEAIQLLLILKTKCSWKHEDPLFTHIYDPAKKRISHHSNTVSIQKTALAFLTIIEQERQ